MRAAWWWIDRWRKSTAYTDMTLAEQGAYRNLLDELWLRGGVIPDDDRILAKISGDAVEWPTVRAKVMARFTRTPEGWRNSTHDEVSAWPAAQSEKGKKRAATALRAGGRFASPAPARPPARPPAQHQPPSPSPSPSPLPTPDNGITDSVAVAPAPIVAVSWSREACDDWQASLGTAPGGRIGHALKPLVGEFGWSHVRPLWREACSQASLELDPSYFTPEVFARTFKARMKGPRRGGKSSVQDRTEANLKEWLKSKEGP